MTKSSLITLAALFALLALCCSCLLARPTTADEAEKVVKGWLKADPKPLGTSLGRQVREVETFTDDSGEALYYIVYLQPSGFVIVSADDLVEPIIGFCSRESFDSSPENALGVLVTNDLTRRIAAVRTGGELRIMADEPFDSQARAKWRHFIDVANAPKGTVSIMALSVPSISDVRVAPLVKSKWDQLRVTLTEDCQLACYNYYAPNNYFCGCPATALAQLMRYHEYPTTGIGVNEFTITVDGVQQKASTRGGDGFGGPYRWDLMPYETNCTTPEAERQAIGALCYDTGVSMNQSYGLTGSGWPGCTSAPFKQSLTTTFKYGNAVHGYNFESPIGGGLIGMINPNLDAKKPVILGTVQHAFVCDGYGYDYKTLYHHLNMGWLGLDDAWYDLNIRIGTSIGMGIVCSCVYNVQTVRAGDGEIISGRVLDHNGEPIANVVLYAKSGSEIIAETETDSKGIYAFDCLESNGAYTVDAMLRGYGFNTQKVTTGVSKDNSVVFGNVWGVDFVGLLCDFNSDQIVDMRDLSRLAQYWGQDGSSLDIAPGPSGDNMVDYKDLALLAEYWLQEAPEPIEPGLVAHWKLDEIEGFIAHDRAGAYEGTLHGDPLWQPAGGKVSGALQLDGVDDYVSTPFILNPAAGPVSVFAWVKGGAAGQAIISQTGGRAGGSTWLGIDPSAGTLMTGLMSPQPPLQSQSVITDGKWHEIGLVWDGSRRHLCIDGAEVAEDSQNLIRVSSDGGLYIGAGNNLEAGSFWSGLIDDIKIYDRAVTP